MEAPAVVTNLFVQTRPDNEKTLIEVAGEEAINILLFAGLDYVGHILSGEGIRPDELPPDYFANKLIYGIPIGTCARELLAKTKLGRKHKSVLYTLSVVGALQTRYLQQFPLTTNARILFLHALVVTPLAYFKIFRAE